MGASASLMMTQTETAYEELYAPKQEGVKKPKVKYFGEVGYRLPLIWAAAFRKSDIGHFKYRGETEHEYVQTTREQALKHLEDAKPILREFFCPDGFLDAYVDFVAEMIEAQTGKYVVFEVFDIGQVVDADLFAKVLDALYDVFEPDCKKPDYETFNDFMGLDFDHSILPLRGCFKGDDDDVSQSLALIGAYTEDPEILYEAPDENDPIGKFTIKK